MMQSNVPITIQLNLSVNATRAMLLLHILSNVIRLISNRCYQGVGVVTNGIFTQAMLNIDTKFGKRDYHELAEKKTSSHKDISVQL